jgi:uncharacterized protein
MRDSSFKEVVEIIARTLVDRPDEVTVREFEAETGIVLELRVDSKDLGKVIGKQGRTARAMRTLLRASGLKSRRKIILEIVE